MKLFITNTTKQHLVLHYRMLETPVDQRPFHITIPMGQQVEMPRDLQPEDLTFLLHQWAPFGLVEHNAIDSTKGFIGISYRVGKPVAADAIQSAVDHNDGEAVKRSERVFQESGVSLANVVAQRAREQGSNLLNTALSVQEDFDGKAPKNAVARGVKISRVAA